MQPFKIIENVISKNTQNRLYDIVTGGDFSWTIRKDSAFAPDFDFPDFWNPFPTISFVKEIYSYGTIVTKEMMPWCLQILDSALDQTGLKMDKLRRIQINQLYGNLNKNYNGSLTTAHVDQYYDHMVLLYYINNSDGDTVLFNEKRDDVFTSFTELTRVKPTQGNALLFDGKYFHSANNPILNNKRLAINFNFTVKG